MQAWSCVYYACVLGVCVCLCIEDNKSRNLSWKSLAKRYKSSKWLTTTTKNAIFITFTPVKWKPIQLRAASHHIANPPLKLKIQVNRISYGLPFVEQYNRLVIINHRNHRTVIMQFSLWFCVLMAINKVFKDWIFCTLCVYVYISPFAHTSQFTYGAPGIV